MSSSKIIVVSSSIATILLLNGCGMTPQDLQAINNSLTEYNNNQRAQQQVFEQQQTNYELRRLNNNLNGYTGSGWNSNSKWKNVGY